MSAIVIIECDDCSSARRGNSYHELWNRMKAEGWKADISRNLHFCPVCARIRDEEECKQFSKRAKSASLLDYPEAVILMSEGVVITEEIANDIRRRHSNG